ncbi:MAG: divalent-cation tolerance protein CutA [Bacteroidales bacterium]|jgi:periplasmic divalent cation tolerance protein|nr:divalent-cation tolerance protein CutA [Bacteroidales bacterium]
MFVGKSKYIIITTTYPSKEQGLRNLVRSLLDAKLAACVQILPVKSFYTWEGNSEENNEMLLIIKTQKALYKRVEAKIKSVHPYEVPQIISIDIKNGLGAYLQWIEDNTKLVP